MVITSFPKSGQSDQPWLSSTVKIICLSMVMLASILLNFPILLAFIKKPHITEQNRYRFIRVQVVINLICTFITMPMSIAIVAVNRWPLGWIFCAIFGYGHQFFVLLCISVVAIISVDRLVAIATPYRHTFRFTARKSNIAIIITALICAILSVPSLIIRLYIISPTFETCTIYFPVYCYGTPEDYNCINNTNNSSNSNQLPAESNFIIQAVLAYTMTCTVLYYVIPFFFILGVHSYILVVANRHRKAKADSMNSQASLIHHQTDRRVSLIESSNEAIRPRTASDSSTIGSYPRYGRRRSNSGEIADNDSSSDRRSSIRSIRRSISLRRQSIVSNVSMIRTAISRHKAAKSLFYVSSAFILCLTGYFTVLVMDIVVPYGSHYHVSRSGKFIAYLLMTFTFLVNPLIYGYSSKEIVKEIKQLFRIKNSNKVSPGPPLVIQSQSRNQDGRRQSIPGDITGSDSSISPTTDTTIKSISSRVSNLPVTTTRCQRNARMEGTSIKLSHSGSKLQDLPENEMLELKPSEKIIRSVSFSFGDAAAANARRQRNLRSLNARKESENTINSMPMPLSAQPNDIPGDIAMRPRAATFVANDERRSSNGSTADDDWSSTATLIKRETINESYSSLDNENDGNSLTSTDRSTITTVLPLININNERNMLVSTVKTLNIEDLKTPARKASSLQPLK